MAVDAPEATHVCVRCGHGNEAKASFCVECGFDLNSALQRDYDSYRDVSRGDLTLSESDGIPVSIIRTLTGVPVAGGEITDESRATDDPVAPVQDPDVETSVGSSVDPEPVVSRPAQEAATSSTDTPLNQATLDTQRGDVLPVEETEELAPEIEPLPMDQIDDPFAPGAPASDDQPKSRPVHENLREGVTTYVHASQRGFRRPDAVEEPPAWGIRVGTVVAVISVVFVIILVLTR